MLLADVAAMFDEKPHAQVHKSEEIIEALNRMEHRPWPEWRQGKPMTARQLAKLLEPFDIAPRQHRQGDANRRGYPRRPVR
jgi:putative DNA primase/helicase